MKYETLTSDEANFQYGLCAFHLGMWEAVNESVAFKHRIPNSRKIISIPHQFCASLRQVVRAFSKHTACQCKWPAPGLDLDQSAAGFF
jgi:hypothetical protein